MATIPRAALDFLSEQVTAISADAMAKVLEVLERVEWTPDNIAECREIVAAALAAVLPTYTDVSAQAGADFYDACRELCVGEAMGAEALSGFDFASTYGALRAIVQDVVDEKPIEQFNAKVLERVDREIRRAANVSVAENTRRDPLKPKYARVPSGADTCSFCLMLASFGFNTGSREAAAHTHANCDCRIVPQWGGDSVEGYDPDEMYGRYNVCLDAIGGRDGVRREWDALPKDEREAYIAKHGGKAGKAFDAFLAKRVSAEIGRRDPEWFMTGKVPEAERRGMERFTIPEAKLTRYALCMESERGRDKAIAFERALGFTDKDAAEIMRQVYRWVGEHEPKFRKTGEYGDAYTTEMVMVGKGGRLQGSSSAG